MTAPNDRPAGTPEAPVPTPAAPPVAAPGAPASTSRPRGRGCAPWAIGCGVVLVVLLLVGGGLTWWFVGRPLQQVFAAVRDAERIAAADARVTNRAPYAPPADGLLTDDQVARFVAVLERTERDVSGRMSELQARYEDLDGRRLEWTDAWRLADAYAGFLRILVDTREAQLDALNAERFSVAEYAWVRAEVLRAASLPGGAYDVGGFLDAFLDQGAVPDRPRTDPAPAANVALVATYRDRLDQVAFLSAFGL